MTLKERLERERRRLLFAQSDTKQVAAAAGHLADNGARMNGDAERVMQTGVVITYARPYINSRRPGVGAIIKSDVKALRAAFATYFLEQKPNRLVALQSLMGHRQPETTRHYLRRLDRQHAMEEVRDLSWGLDSTKAEATRQPEKPRSVFETFRLTEKEGFEPSMETFIPITP